METLNRKEISEALREAMNKEDLHSRATATALNLNPCYISMALNPKSWDSMSNPAWLRLEEWYETREAIPLFKIPDGEEIWKPKERYSGERKEAISMGLRAPNKNKEEDKKIVEKVKKTDPPPVQDKQVKEVKTKPEQKQEFTDAVRLKVALDIEINLVVNGQKVHL